MQAGDVNPLLPTVRSYGLCRKFLAHASMRCPTSDPRSHDRRRPCVGSYVDRRRRDGSHAADGERDQLDALAAAPPAWPQTPSRKVQFSTANTTDRLARPVAYLLKRT